VSTTLTPYRSARPSGRDGFVQLLRAEWTKFRTVRGWTIALLAVTALTALVPIWLAGTAKSNDPETCVNGVCQAEGQTVATGPAGTAVVDAFYFVHQPVSGNASITTAVNALHGTARPQVPPGFGQPPLTQPWAKAGLIIKASTKPGAAYAAVMLTGGHGVRMQYDYTHDLAGPAAGTATGASWLRLTRSGDAVTGYESADGKHWTKIGTAVLPGLPATAQAGLFVASPDFSEGTGSGDNSFGGPTQASASFGSLVLHGGVPGQSWTGNQIGAVTPVPRVGFNNGPPPKGRPGPKDDFTATGGTYSVTGSGDIAPFVPIVDPMHVVFLATLFGLIAVIGLGAVFVTAEYRRSLIRTTVTASPRRGRILLAKSIVVGTATFVAALIGAAIAFPVAAHKVDLNGWKPPVWPQLSLLSSTGLQVVLGTAAIAAAAAVLGLAAGTIFRRSSGAVTAVIGVVVMPLVLAIVLPLSPATWLLRLTPAAAFSLQSTVPHYSQVSHVCAPYHACFPLTPWVGYAVLCAWAVVALGGAIYLLRRRDV
jgi:hypothetical protein